MSELPNKTAVAPEGSSEKVEGAIDSLRNEAQESHDALLVALQRKAAEDLADKAAPIEE